ncbi:hypothetical protein LSCM1_07358 [Leishmania martiniquensis]|uniref:Uncharacterized protein n=1 Tax=Leishmania martiniquensis TaxID=1580590 RepID=A0A836HXP2_9TRYP|nr:hypothetical protein LSCM1_07358 [Leishmania martiniquensis]
MNLIRDGRLQAPQLRTRSPTSAAPSDYEGFYPSRISVRASPAPLLLEPSLRRRQQTSRPASVDVAAMRKADVSALVLRTGTSDSSGQSLPPALHRLERRRSYLQTTESSVSQASVASDASIPASVLRLRTRDNGRGDAMGDGDDSASAAVSRWPLVSRGVRRREWKSASLLDNGGRRKASHQRAVRETGMKARPQSRTLAKRESVPVGPFDWATPLGLAKDAGAANDANRRSDGLTSSKGAASSNGVVRGGARVLASRNTSLGFGSNGHPTWLRSDGTAAASEGLSPLLNSAAALDDNISEFSKFTVSVSLSPMTTGGRSYGKPLQVQPQWPSISEWPGSNTNADPGGLLEYGASIDFREESCTLGELESQATQPMNLGELGSACSPGLSHNAGAPDEGRLPPWTPRSEESPRAEHQRHGNGSLDPDALTLVTKFSRSAERPRGNRPLQLRQRNGPSMESQVPTRDTSVTNDTTATYQASEAQRFSLECETDRKSADSDSIESTSFSAQGERTSGEAERNTRCAASRPYVPRLALAELNAKRELQRSTGAASYKIAHGFFYTSAFNRNAMMMMDSSDMSDLTVSPMTDSVSHGGRSSRCLTSGRPGGFEILQGADHAEMDGNEPSEDVRAGPAASMTVANRHGSAAADYSTYESHGNTSAKEDPCDSWADDTRGGGKAHQSARDMGAASLPLEAPLAEASSGSNRNGGGLAAERRTAEGEKDNSGAGLSRNRRVFQRPGQRQSGEPRPLPPVTKKRVKCCSVM